MATSGIREKLKQIRRLHDDGDEVVLISVVKEVELSQEFTDTEHNNTKLADRNNNLVEALGDCGAADHLVRNRLEPARACVMMLEAYVEKLNVKYSKMFRKAAQSEENHRMRIVSLDSSLKLERIA